MVNLINRISQCVDTQHVETQQLAESPTIILNKNNIGPWIDCWIVQDNLKQQLTNIRRKLSLLNSIEYYTDGSLSTRITDDDSSHYMADNTTVRLGAVFIRIMK
jgi:hypothetical protein